MNRAASPAAAHRAARSTERAEAQFRDLFDARGLYVADEDGVVVFRDIATNPTYVTELTSGVAEPRDLTILE